MLYLKIVDYKWEGSVKTEDIVKLGNYFNEELAEVEFNTYKASALVTLAQLDADYFLSILKNDCNELVGLLGGVISVPPFSTTKIATEIVWYILPKYRGSIKAIKMIKEFEGWAKERGAKHVAMVAQSNSGSDPSRVYERLGYELAEKTFTKRL